MPGRITLAQRLDRPGVIRLAGAHDALGARLAERAGFDGVWASGLEISTSRAVPDANLLMLPELLAPAQDMAEAVSIPVVADCDTGFGNSNNVIRMVRRYEAAGVSAVCIEDKRFPKVNSLIDGRQDLAPVAEFVGKILAAVNARVSDEFLVIARVEAFIAGWGLEEALRRANAYAEAGADAILIHSKDPSGSEIQAFTREWENRVPLVVVPTAYSQMTADELEGLGARIVIYANHGIRASVRAVSETFRSILETGSSRAVDETIAPLSEIFELQGMPQLFRDEAAFLRGDLPDTRCVILAAGDHAADPSMREITADVPISALDVGGRSLLDRQTETLASVGVNDVEVVAGYRHEAVRAKGARKVLNLDWRDTGEAVSLMTAREAHGKWTLVVYGDVLFDPEIVHKLLQAQLECAILVDRSHARTEREGKRPDLARVSGGSAVGRRFLQPQEPARVERIGKGLPDDDANCEFTGLALFSPESWVRLCQRFDALADETAAGPVHEAKDVRRASLTDLLQDLIEDGQEVTAVEIGAGWLEIHRFEDYQLACRLTAP